MSFHDHLGIDVDVHASTATVSLHAQERHLNPLGFVHGGVLASLADVAMAAALNASTAADTAPVTVSLVMTYLEPAPAGATTATGTITRQGKRITIAGAEITAADGTVVATAVGTFTLV